MDDIEVVEEDTPVILVVSRVKKFCAEYDMRIGADALKAINEEAVRIVARAIDRAQTNKVKTIRTQDV